MISPYECLIVLLRLSMGLHLTSRECTGLKIAVFCVFGTDFAPEAIVLTVSVLRMHARHICVGLTGRACGQSPTYTRVLLLFAAPFSIRSLEFNFVDHKSICACMSSDRSHLGQGLMSHHSTDPKPPRLFSQTLTNALADHCTLPHVIHQQHQFSSSPPGKLIEPTTRHP